MRRLQQGISKLNSLSNRRRASAAVAAPACAASGHRKNLRRVEAADSARLVERLDFTRVNDLTRDAMRRDIRRVIEHLCDTENPLLNRIEREKLIEEVLDETLGFGPLEIAAQGPDDLATSW